MTQSNCVPILAEKCTARVYDVIVQWHCRWEHWIQNLRRLRSSHVMIFHLWPLFCCKNYNLITFQALLGVNTDSLLVFFQCTALGIQFISDCFSNGTFFSSVGRLRRCFSMYLWKTLSTSIIKWKHGLQCFGIKSFLCPVIMSLRSSSGRPGLFSSVFEALFFDFFIASTSQGPTSQKRLRVNGFQEFVDQN